MSLTGKLQWLCTPVLSGSVCASFHHWQSAIAASAKLITPSVLMSVQLATFKSAEHTFHIGLRVGQVLDEVVVQVADHGHPHSPLQSNSAVPNAPAQNHKMDVTKSPPERSSSMHTTAQLFSVLVEKRLRTQLTRTTKRYVLHVRHVNPLAAQSAGVDVATTLKKSPCWSSRR